MFSAMFEKPISDMMIKPGASPVFGSPADFDLEFEDVDFEASDGVRLRGWLIPGGGDKLIIHNHFGVQCSRSGYTPQGKGLIKMWKQDIAFLREARHLRDRGYSVLMYDMRNHGESDAGKVPWVTWGPEEALDSIAAAKFVAEHPRYRDAKVGLLNVCMGASACTYAYGATPGMRDFPNIRAMIVVQPLHYREFVKAFGMPDFLVRAGNRLSLERTGYDLSSKTFMDDVKHINVPTLVVQNKNDPWTDLDFVQGYYDALTGEKSLRWLELSKDRAAAYDYLGTNPEMLTEFFDAQL